MINRRISLLTHSASKCHLSIRINSLLRSRVHRHQNKSQAKLRRLVNCKTPQLKGGNNPVRFSEMMKQMLILTFIPKKVEMIERISTCQSQEIRGGLAKRARWDIMDLDNLQKALSKTNSKKTLRLATTVRGKVRVLPILTSIWKGMTKWSSRMMSWWIESRIRSPRAMTIWKKTTK